MVIKIDGLEGLPAQFEYFYSNELFYDLLLAIKDDQPRPPSSIVFSSRPNSIMVSSSRPNSIMVREESTTWENIPEGSSLHESMQSSGVRASHMGDPVMESSRTSDENRPKFWEKYCHQLLLSQHSEYLKKILIKAWKQTDTRPLEGDLYTATLQEKDGKKFHRLELRNVRISSLETILNYIYTGHLEFEEQHFGILIDDARKLGFNLVLQHCEKYLRQEADLSNFISILLCSSYGGHDDVADKCLNFIQDNISIPGTIAEIKKACEKLPFPIFLRLMTSEIVQESTAETFFEMLIQWVDADRNDRLRHLRDLMEPKIALLSFHFLLQNLAKKEVVVSDHASLILLVNAASHSEKPDSTTSATYGEISSPASSKTNRSFCTQTSVSSQNSVPDSPKPIGESALSTSSQFKRSDEKCALAVANITEPHEQKVGFTGLEKKYKPSNSSVTNGENPPNGQTYLIERPHTSNDCQKRVIMYENTIQEDIYCELTPRTPTLSPLSARYRPNYQPSSGERERMLEPLFHFTSPPLETHGNSLQRRAVTMENIFPPTSPTQQRFRTDEKTLFVLSGVSRGEGSGVHEKFNSSTNSWDLWMQKDLGVAFQAVMVHEVLVVLGGMKDDVIHSNVWIYNFSTHKWSIGPKMITSRIRFASCVFHGNTVMTCGGKNVNNEELETCEMLKLSQRGPRSWEQLPPMEVKRKGCAAVCMDNKVYVVGGRRGNSFETLMVYPLVEAFDTTSQTWSRKRDMNEARSQFAITSHENAIYVFGGWRDNNCLESCERYDSIEDNWQNVCCLPSPRAACAVGRVGNRIHIIGGGDESWDDSTEIYDTEKDEFSKGPNLQNRAVFPVCVALIKR